MIIFTDCSLQFKSPAAAVNNLEHGLSEKTDEAVAEGQDDAQGYVAQAKNLASSAMATAQVWLVWFVREQIVLTCSVAYQSYLPNSSNAVTKDGTGSTTASLQSTASSAFQTTKEYIASASNAAAPVANSALNASIAAMETAKTTAAPYVQSAADAVSRAVSGNTQSGSSTNGVTSKTAAPLQTGGQAVSSPYTTDGEKPNVADV